MLVVDNNSTDQTRAVAEDYCRNFPGRFRYVFEPAQGLSRARNAGIHQAQGEIIAFIDDDVIAEPTWLQNLTAPLIDGQWAGAGGRIVPPPDFSPPDWLDGWRRNGPSRRSLALVRSWDQAGEMNRPPYGANMAFRKNMFEKYGNFRVDLGRCGTKLLMGEDIEFGNGHDVGWRALAL